MNDEIKYESNREFIKSLLINKKDEYEIDEPFYIINLKTIENLYNIWHYYLPNIKPYYAVKCNTDINIIELLASLGCNFDCASKEEIKKILAIAEPEKIIYANPCKQKSYIKYAKDNKVDKMTFDCIEELYKINECYKEAKLILRIAVDDSNSLCKFNSKFGLDINNIDYLHKIINYIREHNLNLYGISFHVGSGCSSSYVYYDALKKCKYVHNILVKYQIDIKMIDIGGGFTYNNNTFFKEVAHNIKKGISDLFTDTEGTENIEFIAEPGRYFTELSHILVVNVIAKKQEKDVIKYYINDGIYGSLNCIHFDHKKPIFNILNDTPTRLKYNSTIFGPTCDSMDVIYKDIEFESLDVGEWLYIENFGSYTNSACGDFNGFRTTKKIYVYSK